MDTDQFSDQEIVAKTVWGEARGEIPEGRQAVANVIMNRANNPGWWGNDARSVCLKPYQFSCWLESDPNRPKLMEVTDTDQIYAGCLQLAANALSGDLPDLTQGANSYKRVGTTASWADGKTPVVTIGNHEFYVL